MLQAPQMYLIPRKNQTRLYYETNKHIKSEIVSSLVHLLTATITSLK